MLCYITVILCLAHFGCTASTFNRAACQATTPENPLSGRPRGTLLVSANNTHARYKTIQSAIDSLPHDDSNQVLLVLRGNYTEQINITRPGPLTIYGETDNPYNSSTNLVNFLWAAATSQGIYTDNVQTSALIVAPTYQASLTGSGIDGLPVPENTPFGCKNFRLYNVNVRNVYADQSAGPSHAMSFSRANGGFYYSGFYSFQDTLYVGKLGNAYFKHSIIAGETDFIYGFGTAWIEQSEIILRGCGGGIIAWKGTNTTYDNKFGAYVHNSVIRPANASVEAANIGRCALGRAWNSQHRSIWANTYEDADIIGSGYVIWNPTNNLTLLGEYNDYGPGFNLTAREISNISMILPPAEYEPYSSPSKVFMNEYGTPNNVWWIDTRI